MKKVKIKERLQNAANAFFENGEETYGENSLIFASDSGLLKQEKVALLSKKGDVLVKILKRTFLFLPGALYLFFGTLSVLTFEFFQNKPWAFLIIFLIGGFMTIFGIGKLKNPKHLLIPFSIIAVGFATFAIFSLFGLSRYVFEYGIYLFPLALIVPFLVKELAGRSEKKKIEI
jgi:hypothetical protein